MSRKLFVFTLNTKKDYYQKGDIVFGSDGATLGRVIRQMRIAIDDADVYYSCDVESTPEDYAKLKTEGYKLYIIDEYSVHDCSVSYFAE